MSSFCSFFPPLGNGHKPQSQVIVAQKHFHLFTGKLCGRLLPTLEQEPLLSCCFDPHFPPLGIVSCTSLKPIKMADHVGRAEGV